MIYWDLLDEKGNYIGVIDGTTLNWGVQNRHIKSTMTGHDQNIIGDGPAHTSGQWTCHNYLCVDGAVDDPNGPVANVVGKGKPVSAFYKAAFAGQVDSLNMDPTRTNWMFDPLKRFTGGWPGCRPHYFAGLKWVNAESMGEEGSSGHITSDSIKD